MDIQKLQDQIKGEWNIVRAFVANNQLASIGIAFAAGWVIAKLL